MGLRAVRFLQSGDWHLDRPVFAGSGLPDRLVDVLIEAPYAAAARAIQLAISEQVDFVLLTGDLFDKANCPPRTLLFLREQFNKLAEAEIPVYWSLGPAEPLSFWPEPLQLPPNVRRFGSELVEESLVERAGEPLARVIGCGNDGRNPLRLGEFAPDRAGLFTIAVVYGNHEPEVLAARKLNYWAVGGSHRWNFHSLGPSTIHDAGTIQGRNANEAGPHGCSLVYVDDAQARPTLVPIDVVRWETPRVEIAAEETPQQLFERLMQCAEEMLREAAGADVVVRWTITGQSPLLEELGHPGGCEPLLAQLRNEWSLREPTVWTAAIGIDHDDVLPSEWFEEQSFRGDVLRVLRHWELNTGSPLGTAEYLTPDVPAEPWLGEYPPHDEARRHLLRRAAATVVRLLSEREPRP